MAPTSDDGRDLYFVCKCGGDIVHTKTLDSGRKVYQCSCNNPICNGEMLACVICHLPKTIWADDGDICAGCGLRFLNREITLTPEHIAGMERWMIILKIQ